MPFDENTAAELLPQDHTAAPAPASPRGRPFEKGRSGNPRGRPSRAHQAAWVGQHLIDRKIIPLIDGTIGRAQVGDRPSARALLERLVPPRREAPVWLKIPPIEASRDVKEALRAVANGVAQGDIPSAQGLRLVQMYTQIYRYL